MILPIVHRTAMSAALALTILGFASQRVANAQVARVGDLTVLNVQGSQAKADFANAKPMPLPVNPMPADTTQAMIQALLSKHSLGTSGFSPGAEGTGITSPVFVGVPAATDEIAPQDFGTYNHPFTTVRADLYGLNTNTVYPYRAAGNLNFKIDGAGYICSASMIKRGIAVTAAHCVTSFGSNKFYSGWTFAPGYRNGSAPFGTWTVKQVWVKTAYLNGTDSCATAGIVCADDVAVLILNTQSGAYPGTTTGWFGYWYGGGLTSNGLTQVTQLGYPAGLDKAAYMERTDSQGYISSSNSNNTVIGSNMDGGSSGGPWIANFGLPSVLSGETAGSFPSTNVIIGVTSWGYTSTAPKEQGASPFTSNNIQSLLNSACAATPAACS